MWLRRHVCGLLCNWRRLPSQATAIERRDVARIEYMIRKAKKQLEVLQMTGVTGVSVT
jgi:hypothetical protein